MTEIPEALTQQLAAAGGDQQVESEVIEAVYQELLRLARSELAKHRRGATLNTRVLVNEAYLKLFAGSRNAEFQNRKHFFASAALVMRHIVVDHARRKLADRRGGGVAPLDLDEQNLAVESQAENILALDDALHKLAERDPRLAEVMVMRFFAGLSVEELAEQLGVSAPTIKRDTRIAKAFLRQQLGA
ncbi:ECF-type sigma factor [Wenzhouxiangella marina]|uniref:ECF-type sigma factor n=1 Tax=Wenzhouxiangella marina TaxID=1579979 RepID=UPI0006735FCB|nr:ECF-type sigma factor [Wenzhouxiangella marina]MBB6087438.1 RNA polymerase sigma factor (TIGR02999 family) [Wenzhouxiangella marina]